MRIGFPPTWGCTSNSSKWFFDRSDDFHVTECRKTSSLDKGMPGSVWIEICVSITLAGNSFMRIHIQISNDVELSKSLKKWFAAINRSKKRVTFMQLLERFEPSDQLRIIEEFWRNGHDQGHKQGVHDNQSAVKKVLGVLH